MTRPALDLPRYWVRSIPQQLRSEPGSIPVGTILETGAAWCVPAARSLLLYFCQLIPRVSLLVFLLVSTTIEDENCY